MEIRLEPSWKARLEAVAGDLTGLPTESALIVSSKRKLPLGKVFADRFVYVHHRGDRSEHRSVYTVDKITSMANDLYRIDLKHCPSFIDYTMNVVSYDKAEPLKIVENFMAMKGLGPVDHSGKKMRFLRSGFRTELSRTSGTSMFFKDEPKDGDLRKGDLLIVHTIALGDQVILPSFFTC